MLRKNNKITQTLKIIIIFCFIGWIGFSLIDIKEKRSEVSAVSPTPELNVHHFIRGDKLFLEFRIKHFMLADEKMGGKSVYGEGHLHLIVDGKDQIEISRGAYVYNGLAVGEHKVKVELVHHNHDSYGIHEEFTIQVPKLKRNSISE